MVYGRFQPYFGGGPAYGYDEPSMSDPYGGTPSLPSVNSPGMGYIGMGGGGGASGGADLVQNVGNLAGRLIADPQLRSNIGGLFSNIGGLFGGGQQPAGGSYLGDSAYIGQQGAQANQALAQRRFSGIGQPVGSAPGMTQAPIAGGAGPAVPTNIVAQSAGSGALPVNFLGSGAGGALGGGVVNPGGVTAALGQSVGASGALGGAAPALTSAIGGGAAGAAGGALPAAAGALGAGGAGALGGAGAALGAGAGAAGAGAALGAGAAGAAGAAGGAAAAGGLASSLGPMLAAAGPALLALL